jgi:capsular polysaccharide export protein
MGEQSTMPRDPDRIKQLAETMKEVDFTPRYRDSSIRMSMGDLVGSLGNVFLRFLYPHYRQSDERPHPLIYFPAMGLSLLRRSFLATAARQQSEAFLLSGQPFFLFPLQLDHDFQIRAYSPFKGLGEAIDHVLDSFFEHAPRDCHLLIKTHPWDPGLDNWKSRIEKRARNAAISGRVHYVEGGSLDEMIAAARGLVTVNSTSGLRALQLNCPVKVLGGAIYDIKGLTAQISLDDFWRAAPQPEYELLTCFINVLVTATQVRGVFFEPYGKALAIDAFTEKVARVD